MKKILLLAVIALSISAHAQVPKVSLQASRLTTVFSNAQVDTTKIEQYCQLIATPRVLSNKVTIDIDFGDEKSIWRDGRIKDYDGKIKKFNTIIDALNYMGQQGWLFINAYPVTIGQSTIFHFAFKKQFVKADFTSIN